MLFLMLALVIITSDSVTAEGPPRKLSPDGHRRILFAHVTESLTLKCPLELSESPTFVEWMKGNTSLYMMQGYEITQKGFLKIKSVTNEHAGTYTCEGINGYGSVRVNLTLIIDTISSSPEDENQKHSAVQPNSSTKRTPTYPPSIVKRPSSVVADVGGEATYHCVASGQPLPRIFWLKDGQLVENGSSSSYISGRRTHSTLKLRSLRKADAGIYKCIARNKIGEDEADVSLYVTEPSPPPRILTLDPASAIISEGATATFVCNVVSKAGTQLHIKWLKYYQEAGGNDDINLFRLESAFYRPLNLPYTVSTHDGVHKSKLVLQNACKDDEGSYICLALNDAGFNFKNSTLKVIQTSATLSSPSASSVSNTSLALIVTVVFVILLAVTILVSHLLCRSKSEDKGRQAVTKIPDSDSFSIKKSNKECLNHYPDLRDPQYISHLLRTESTFSYENEESQVSKLTHPKLCYHS